MSTLVGLFSYVAIAAGADLIRVHDVAAMARVVRVADAIVRANWSPPTSP